MARVGRDQPVRRGLDRCVRGGCLKLAAGAGLVVFVKNSGVVELSG